MSEKVRMLREVADPLSWRQNHVHRLVLDEYGVPVENALSALKAIGADINKLRRGGVVLTDPDHIHLLAENNVPVSSIKK